MGKFRFYTLWIAGICVIAYLLQFFIKGFSELFVLNSRAIYNHETWRFVSAIFLHGSLIHLLFNILALIMFGLLTEKLIGGKKFLLLFFASGIIANLVSINFYASSLGASGAIMGIIGCLAVISPFMMVWAFGLILPMFIAAIVWIIGDLIGVFYPTDVGNIAHLSGIGVGFLVGLILRIRSKGKFRVVRTNRIKLHEDSIRRWEEGWKR